MPCLTFASGTALDGCNRGSPRSILRGITSLGSCMPPPWYRKCRGDGLGRETRRGVRSLQHHSANACGTVPLRPLPPLPSHSSPKTDRLWTRKAAYCVHFHRTDTRGITQCIEQEEEDKGRLCPLRRACASRTNNGRQRGKFPKARRLSLAGGCTYIGQISTTVKPAFLPTRRHARRATVGTALS